MVEITESELREVYDYEGAQSEVAAALEEARRDFTSLLRFVGRYASWNGRFGAGVASLAGKIGRCRDLFLDPEQPVVALADRSVLVASYFFDAARDEFDDREHAHRDTHRCLAQAMIVGMVRYARQNNKADVSDAALAGLLADPIWLQALQDRVRTGYGDGSRDTRPSLFRAMGFHLGSEVFADQEFSVLDAALRKSDPELVGFLDATSVPIGDEKHNAYHWLSIHSGHGGGAEADHFEWAVAGVRQAFRYAPAAEHEELRHQVHVGFLDFVQDHREFFARVNGA